MRVVEFVLEQSILTTSGDDPTVTNPDMGWAD